jgi:hypothetical protein
VLPPNADLKAALAAERQRLVDEGWAADELTRYSFVFCRRANERVLRFHRLLRAEHSADRAWLDDRTEALMLSPGARELRWPASRNGEVIEA